MRPKGQITPASQQRITEASSVIDSGCWEWNLAKDRHGYGRLKSNGKTVLAHRASYEVFSGPIPDGLAIDHLCRNRACVNPDHLEAVTAAENSARGASSRSSCLHGHLYDEANTYIRTKNNARICRTCSRLRSQLSKRKRALHTQPEPTRGQSDDAQ